MTNLCTPEKSLSKIEYWNIDHNMYLIYILLFLIFVCYGVTIPLGHVNGYIYFVTLGGCKMGVCDCG